MSTDARPVAVRLKRLWAARGRRQRRHGLGGITPSRVRRLGARLGRGAADLRAALLEDLDNGQAFPWLVVSLAAGVWLYYALPQEPQVWATTSLALILAVFARRRRAQGRATIPLCLAALACGVAVAGLRTERVAAPRLPASGAYEVAGWVETVEPRARGYRLTVRPTRVGRLAATALPRRLRVSARAPRDAPHAGSAVAFLARLSPPQGPVLPGGYAFDLAAYYDGVGGSGFVLGRVRPTELGSPPLALRASAALARFRNRIGDRIREGLPGDAGAIAAALIVGDRGAVSETAQENLRVAGLAHVLAISGMHMALVAGSIFFAVRAMLALSPGLALSAPIRSWAAAAALVAASAYLLLSGASIATQRAYIMAAIVFVAMILGRPAVTMRSVALAAAIVLVLTPEALLQPGFQMSFCAVIALVATYRAWSRRRARRERSDGGTPTRLGRFTRGLAMWTAGLAVTSLIAGTATAPIAVAHFHRSAPFGLLANMAAMPLVSLAIMPAAVAAVVLMPFGLESLPLAVMGAGIDAMLAIAGRVSAWTPGGGVVGAVPPAAPIAFVAGLLWLALWTSRWRWLGAIPAVASVAIALTAARPDVFVSADGRTLAVRGPDGRLAVAQGRGGRFAAEIWLRADGDDGALAARRAAAPLMRCDDWACVVAVPPAQGRAGVVISRIADPRAFAEDCRRADVIVTALDAPRDCAALVLDRAFLAAHGAVSMRLARLPSARGAQQGRTPADTEKGAEAARHDTRTMHPRPDRPALRARLRTARAPPFRPWQGPHAEEAD